jgi:hypothetical protein
LASAALIFWPWVRGFGERKQPDEFSLSPTTLRLGWWCVGTAMMDTEIQRRGNLTPEWWNPHTGKITGSSHSHERMDGVDVTKLRVALDAGASVLAVAPETPDQ